MTNARAVLMTLFALSGMIFAQSIPAKQSSSDDIKITAFPNAIFELKQFKSGGLVRSKINLQGNIAGCTTGSYDGSDPKSKPSGGAATTRVIDMMWRDRTAESPAYVTFQTTLGSGCNVQGMCGAGSAVTVVWLELDPKLKVISKKAVIVQDCLTNTGLTQWIGKTGDDVSDSTDPKFRLREGNLEIVFETENYNKKQKVVSILRYSKNASQKGLIVSSKTFPIK
jgi:hypothetical protein